MEYANLGNLRSIMKTYGPLCEQTLVVYLKQILSGLAYLHRNKIIHRDIKPSNLLINNDVEVKVSDFGCSFQMNVSETRDDFVSTFKGSIPYMAPELLRETQLSRKSDIWSIGCSVLELVTEKEPWHEKNFDNYFAAILEIGTQPVTPTVPDELSEDVKDFIQRCLKRDPNERPSAEELLEHKLIKKFESDC